MASFRDIVEAPAGSKFILQGNAAFALGVVHAGYHAADGYPGTPSTEVIDRSLAYVQDRVQVGWSVNEAVAVNLCVGRAMAGFDSVVTMKIPGVFQAGDAITTSAFYTAPAGALVIFAASDYVPSSTQHVIDSRYFFSSSRLPILEPRSHQEMYEIAWTAADISKQYHTPVVVLASGILTHSEGLVSTLEPRRVEPMDKPKGLQPWMLMPVIARANYNQATGKRIPGVQAWAETSSLVDVHNGADDWGVIASGESTIIVKEALASIGADPSLLSLAITYPLPKEQVRSFAAGVKKELFVFEDGDRYLEDRLRLLGLDVIGKEENSILTDWTPESVLGQLSKHIDIDYQPASAAINIPPLGRPPSLCPGCAYRAFAVKVSKLKKQKRRYAPIGDIGCSTLLFFLNSLDTVGCMGSSDSMRQGFVLSRPEMAGKLISVIGDSCECHSGLDSTRNAVFRNVPGIKIILDNRVTAMTGGQPAPSSEKNLAGQPHNFDLRKAVAGEVERTVVVDAYDMAAIEKELKEAMALAEQGVFTAMIIEGTCIHETPPDQIVRSLEIDYDLCNNCGLCAVCPGIELDENRRPSFTSLCTNCGSNTQVCRQCCPLDAIVPLKIKDKAVPPQLPEVKLAEKVELDKDRLPGSLRVAIRGIGGQGNLFFGRVLSEVAMRTPYRDIHIVKGDTHGMAQLGGSVISTFSCGDVHSPVLAPGSADVLVVMEVSEVLRPGFLDLLKPGGTIIFNTFTALPANVKKEDYPDISIIEQSLSGYRTIKVDANQVAHDIGDKMSRTANVVVLGLLSTIEPFNQIPEAVWQAALMAISPTDLIKSANQLAFTAGRKIQEPS
jgi:indolepyruvate ferredoxin oxidoreductase alpha subunit